MFPVPTWRFDGRRLIRFAPVLIAAALSIVMLDHVRAAGEPWSGGSKLPTQQVAPNAVAPAVYNLQDGVPYSDCTGNSPLGPDSVYLDSCLPGIYLLAHNPGPFTALLGLKVGSRVSYRHRIYNITRIYETTPELQWAYAQKHSAPLTLHTCANGSGSLIWVFAASPAQ